METTTTAQVLFQPQGPNFRQFCSRTRASAIHAGVFVRAWRALVAIGPSGGSPSVRTCRGRAATPAVCRPFLAVLPWLSYPPFNEAGGGHRIHTACPKPTPPESELRRDTNATLDPSLFAGGNLEVAPGAAQRKTGIVTSGCKLVSAGG